MLILTRKPGQALTIRPERTMDLNTPLEQIFGEGPIRVEVTGVSGYRVRLGVAAHSGLCILREELEPFPAVGPLPEGARLVLARKIKVLKIVHKLSTESLATSAGLSLTTVMAAEHGAGVLYLDDLEKLALALGVSVAYLFRPPGRTPEERAVLALLEEG